MASPASLQAPLFRVRSFRQVEESRAAAAARRPHVTRIRDRCLLIRASAGGGRRRPPPGVDTRIHWENDEDGWVGGSASRSQDPKRQFDDEQRQRDLLGDRFADLLNDASNSHYQFLGVPVDADMEEIKAAYRRLSKEYHPDTTSMPLKAASEKFMKLRQVYDVLSDEERRRFYDWTLAQEAASRKAEKMRMRLLDPYQQELRSYKPQPDMVDRLGGRNMDLSDQAYTALTIDLAILLFAIACILYVLFFKQPYY